MSASTTSAKLVTIRKGTVCTVCEQLIRNTKAERENRQHNGTELCAQCFHEAGLENEHQDGLHDEQANDECPMCREVPVCPRQHTAAGAIARCAAYYARNGRFKPSHTKAAQGTDEASA